MKWWNSKNLVVFSCEKRVVEGVVLWWCGIPWNPNDKQKLFTALIVTFTFLGYFHPYKRRRASYNWEVVCKLLFLIRILIIQLFKAKHSMIYLSDAIIEVSQWKVKMCKSILVSLKFIFQKHIISNHIP